MKTNVKKLALSKETLRALHDAELKQVAAGNRKQPTNMQAWAEAPAFGDDGQRVTTIVRSQTCRLEWE